MRQYRDTQGPLAPTEETMDGFMQPVGHYMRDHKTKGMPGGTALFPMSGIATKQSLTDAHAKQIGRRLATR